MPETTTGQEQVHQRTTRVIDKNFDDKGIERPEIELGLFPPRYSQFPELKDVDFDPSRLVIDFAEIRKPIMLGSPRLIQHLPEDGYHNARNKTSIKNSFVINLEGPSQHDYSSSIQAVEIAFGRNEKNVNGYLWTRNVERTPPIVLEYGDDNTVQPKTLRWGYFPDTKAWGTLLEDGKIFLFSESSKPQESKALVVVYREEPQSHPFRWTFRRIDALSDISPQDVIKWQAYRNEEIAKRNEEKLKEEKKRKVDRGEPREVTNLELTETVRSLQEKLRGYHNAGEEIERLKAENKRKDSEIENLKKEIEELNGQKTAQRSSGAERLLVNGLVENLLANNGYSQSEFKSLTRSSQEAVLKQLERSLRTMNHEGTLKTESQDRKQRQEDYMKNALQELDNFAEQYGIILGPGNSK